MDSSDIPLRLTRLAYTRHCEACITIFQLIEKYLYCVCIHRYYNALCVTCLHYMYNHIVHKVNRLALKDANMYQK